MENDDPLIIIVDDDDAIRDAVANLLASVGIDAIGFGSPAEAEKASLPDRPGCFILDVRMPGASGLDFQRQLCTGPGRGKPVIFLTAHGDIPMSVQAMKAGAIDFLTKPFRDQTLLDAIQTAIARDCAQRRASWICNGHLERFSALTPREREVMQHVAMGRLNKQIAYDLGITEVTVKLHRSNVMRKMNLASASDLVRSWETIAPHLPRPADGRAVSDVPKIAARPPAPIGGRAAYAT
jgi:FixJ family two-component response regulator